MLQNIFTEDHIWYGIIYYFIYSIGGLYFMQRYICSCKDCNVIPFNSSVLKAFFMLVICGLFTQIIILYGVVAIIFDFFRKKD
jgi:hypothetical protein